MNNEIETLVRLKHPISNFREFVNSIPDEVMMTFYGKTARSQNWNAEQRRENMIAYGRMISQAEEELIRIAIDRLVEYYEHQQHH